ncbi:MAG: (2Fe-2S)-binding protein [Candidatus Methylacidiphilales bacterium]|nr:(2Fe-2S)-binding protein [Candidatus Methylacidiphilales bacterium]
MSSESTPPPSSSSPPATAGSSGGFNRRSFLRGLGTTFVAAASAQANAVAQEIAKTSGPGPQGPGAVPVTLTINGAKQKFTLEPRVTLLEALRNHSPNTGAKEVCDRATCGACTVLLDGKPIYACSALAIDCEGSEITTVEGLSKDGKLTPVQEAFVQCDALMCGFCTPGFVMSVTALLKTTPKPTEAEVRHACAGNICRCGTYPNVLKAALKAGGVPVAQTTTVINYAELA